MFKLRFSAPFIRQYMDGKITVCKYECVIINTETKEIQKKFTVTGYAKCAPEDTVDASFGRKLADSRAKRNAYKEALNICPHYIEQLVEIVNTGLAKLDFIESLQYLKKKEIDHIQEICKESK